MSHRCNTSLHSKSKMWGQEEICSCQEKGGRWSLH